MKGEDESYKKITHIAPSCKMKNYKHDGDYEKI